MAGAVGTVFERPALCSSVSRDSAVAFGPAHLGSLDLSLAPVPEVLRQSQKLCLTPENVEGIEFTVDGVLPDCSFEGKVVARFFPSEWETGFSLGRMQRVRVS